MSPGETRSRGCPSVCLARGCVSRAVGQRGAAARQHNGSTWRAGAEIGLAERRTGPPWAAARRLGSPSRWKLGLSSPPTRRPARGKSLSLLLSGTRKNPSSRPIRWCERSPRRKENRGETPRESGERKSRGWTRGWLIGRNSPETAISGSRIRADSASARPRLISRRGRPISRPFVRRPTEAGGFLRWRRDLNACGSLF